MSGATLQTRVVNELEQMYLFGRIDPYFIMHDKLLSALAVFWIKPTLDAMLFSLEAVKALPTSALDNRLRLYLDPDNLVRFKTFLLEFQDIMSGGIKHSTSARFVTLYATQALLKILPHFSGKGKGMATLKQLTEFLPNWGFDVERLVEYVQQQQSSEGGFFEPPGRPCTVEATYRGLSILNALGTTLRFEEAHADFLTSALERAASQPRLEKREAGLTPTRYFFEIADQYLHGEAKERVLAKAVEFQQPLTSFLEDCRADGGGFSFAPHEAPNVLATWDAMQLVQALNHITESVLKYGGKFSPMKEAAHIAPNDVLVFLRGQSQHGAFGFTKGSMPNLYATAAACKIAGSIRGQLGEEAKPAFNALEKEMAAALHRFRDRGTGLFSCYGLFGV